MLWKVEKVILQQTGLDNLGHLGPGHWVGGIFLLHSTKQDWCYRKSCCTITSA